MSPFFVYYPTAVMFGTRTQLLSVVRRGFVADLNLHIFPKDIRSRLYLCSSVPMDYDDGWMKHKIVAAATAIKSDADVQINSQLNNSRLAQGWK